MVTVKLEPNVVVVAMATWCPFATQFRDKVNKHRTDANMKDLRFVYVFDDEWPVVRQMLLKEGGGSSEEIDKQLAAKREAQGGHPVVMPEFLKECNAEVYFTHPAHKLPRMGYPSIIAANGQARPVNGLPWLEMQITK